jgi:hypothetical protein
MLQKSQEEEEKDIYKPSGKDKAIEFGLHKGRASSNSEEGAIKKGSIAGKVLEEKLPVAPKSDGLGSPKAVAHKKSRLADFESFKRTTINGAHKQEISSIFYYMKDQET